MHVASKELCEELYAVSKWGRMDNATSTDHYYVARWVTVRSGQPDMMQDWEVEPWESFNEVARLHMSLDRGKAIPAYTLGYLLRKLPKHMYTAFVFTDVDKERWVLDWKYKDENWKEIAGPSIIADTPEGALATLCIELIKRGILTPERK